jgi:hypothetical protein
MVLLSSSSLAADKGRKKEKKAEGKDVVIDSQLTNADLFDKVRNDCYCKTYSFKMIEGRRYQIDMVSADVDSYLRLEDPAGQQVAADDDGGGFPNARITYVAPKTGDYSVIATTFNNNATGKFTLTIRDLSAPAKEKEKEKDKVGGKTELKLDKGRASVTGQLNQNDPQFMNRPHKEYVLNMDAGKTYQIDMVSNQFDSYLFLLDPDGKVVAQDDDGGGFPNARIIYTAGNAGRYRVLATRFSGVGEFNLSVEERAKE